MLKKVFIFLKNKLHIILIVLILIVNLLYILITKKIDLCGTAGSILGVISVTLIAKGNIHCFWTGAISNILFAIIAFNAQLYGSMLLNLFYLTMQGIGYINWKKHLKDSSSIVKPKSFELKKFIWLIVIGIIIVCIYGVILSFLHNRNPILDAFVSGFAIVAMILGTKRYTAQWPFWIMANITNIVLWVLALGSNVESSFLMISTLTIFLINSIFGWYNWNKL